MTGQRLTLPQFLNVDQRSIAGATGDFTGLVMDIAIASKTIANAISHGALTGGLEDLGTRLHAQAAEVLLEACANTRHLAATLSPEGFSPSGNGSRGKYLLTFEPLAGTRDVDINFQSGTIFSLMLSPDPDRRPQEEDFLRPGQDLVCAGMVQYGSSTRFILATGLGVNGFTLDRELGEYVLTHPNIQVPPDTAEVSAIAVGNRSWEPPMRRYMRECLQGKDGPRAKQFHITAAGSLVAETSRVITRGGVFLYPHDETTQDGTSGHLHLLIEARPVSWLVERAGGAAITGRTPILEILPESMDQHVPLIIGSRNEVDRLHTLHRNYVAGLDDTEDELPLFGNRSLYR